MAEPYERATSLTGPAPAGAAVTFESPPADFTFSQATRALYVGGAGTVMVLFSEGGAAVPHVCTAGAILPVRATGIAESGTTATDIVGWF